MSNCDHQGKGVRTTRDERTSRFTDSDGKVHCIKTIQVTNYCQGCGTELGTQARSEACD